MAVHALQNISVHASEDATDRAAGSGGAGAAVAAPQFLISHASDNMSHTFYCRSKKVVLAHVLAKRPN